MAWTTPKTWASGYVVLAADLNTHLRDNLNVTAPAVMSSQGDVIYASGANTPARLAKSATSTQYLANTGSSNNPAWNEVALATGVSGTLPVGNGGTGATSLTANGILVGNSTSAVAVTATMATKGHLMAGDGSGVPSMLAVGTNDYVLTADSGEGTGIKWAAVAGAAADFQRFTSSGTWTKPTGTVAIMEVIGGGGGGAAGGGSGGGGGALSRGVYTAANLASSLTVTIGAAGSGGAQGGANAGAAGGASSVAGTGFVLSAYGGGGGGSPSYGGGGGGGAGVVGGNSTSTTGATGGMDGVGNSSGGAGGKGGDDDENGFNAEFGGGGGGGIEPSTTGHSGGSSLYGGAGGGAAGHTTGNYPGGPGGAWGSYTAGGGGAGADASGNGGDGGDNAFGCGDGGGGGDGGTSGSGGGAGGTPGGGGGGGSGNGTAAGGDGSIGEVRIWTFA